MKNSIETFKINYQNSEIQLDGIINKNEWNKSSIIKNLSSPWALDMKDSTSFRCYCSDQFFYFSFDVIDDDIKIIDNLGNDSVVQGDRVEIFLSPTSELNMYYCMEIDPNGRVFDYKAEYYRQFDSSWNFKRYEIVSTKNEIGYIVEGRISVSELRRLNIDLYKGFYMGIYRADCIKIGNLFNWFSWIDPKTDNPDFHVPSAFQFCRVVIQ